MTVNNLALVLEKQGQRARALRARSARNGTLATVWRTSSQGKLDEAKGSGRSPRGADHPDTR